MNYVYQQVLQRLFERLSQAQRASLQLLIQRLLVAAGGMERIDGFKVMLAYGGGHTSAYALACLRAAQLSIAARGPGTFRLRVVTTHHAGVSETVQGNIERAFSALMMHDDPRVELLMVDDGEVHLFDAREPVSAGQKAAERLDMLIVGHLTAGQTRQTFLNRCYLELADLHRLGSSYDGGVDAVINVVPQRKRKRYLAWGRRMLREAGLAGMQPVEASPAAMFQTFAVLRHNHLTQVLGEPIRPLTGELPHRAPRFVAIDDLLIEPERGQRDLLETLLGLRYDNHAFGFDEAIGGNPLLVAHLHGLRAAFVELCSYAEGIDAYVNQAQQLPRMRPIPSSLAAMLQCEHQRDNAAERLRYLASELAVQAFDLSEGQLVCLLYAPFIEQGRNLELFLRRCHPNQRDSLPGMIRALQGRDAAHWIKEWLEATSGLSMENLQMLYRRKAKRRPADR
ncbi:hypothetical protein DCO48_07410 [Pseudomonas sp. SDI]|nr:hypothetical protein DCO48_07410 [Pseudomonas sp. SDI]